MPATKFGSMMLTTSPAVLMTGAAGMDSTANVVFVNQTIAAVTVSLLYSTSLIGVQLSDYLVFNQSIAAGGSFEFNGIAVQAGFVLIASASTTNVSAIAYGFQENS